MRESDWPNLNTLWAEVLVDELARCGLRTVVISPGSRSTPLVMAFAAHPDIEDLSIIDERSAAFFALGVARATRTPTAVVCTSGTAAANYFPAICEANADDVPLVVLTADRPVDRLESGASQAMDQTKLYGDQVRWFHDLGLPELDARRIRALRSTMGLAWRHATSMVSGPVHLNVPFRKPLEPVAVPGDHRDAVPDPLPADIARAVDGRSDGAAFSPFDTPQKAPSTDTVERFLDAILNAERPLILAGADAEGDEYGRLLDRIASRAGVPVLAEPTSGLRFQPAFDAILSAGDALLRSEMYGELGEPDLLIQLGKPPLHWAARKLARELETAGRISVTPSGRRLEPDHAPTWFIEADTRTLLDALIDEIERRRVYDTSSDWLDAHRAANTSAVKALNAAMDDEDALHEARIWRELGQALPEDAALFVSNSMPIRHFDTFMQGRSAPLEPFFNRGLNGIDGILSTGFGVAHARTAPTDDGSRRSNTVIVTGDVAFRHDIGALLTGRRLGTDATIVVCDNGGGGIFAALPIVDFEEAFEAHFVTPPGLDASDEMLGVSVAEPASWDDFRALLDESLDTRGVQIIRVRTDREADVQLVDQHADRACQAVMDTVSGHGTAANHHAMSGQTGPTPILALHGFSGSGRDWSRHAWAFDDRRLHAPDLPGHGERPRLDLFAARGLSSATAWLDSQLHRVAATRIHLAGYSMGGRIALAYALRYPERVASLSLLGAHPGIRDLHEREDRARWDEQMAASLEEDGLHPFVDEWMQHPVLVDQLELDHGEVVAARQGRLCSSSSGLAAAFRHFGTGSQRPLWDDLPALQVPTLFLAGARDTKYVGVGEEAAQASPEIVFEVVEDAGHNVLLEQPRATLSAIRKHIERVESS